MNLYINSDKNFFYIYDIRNYTYHWTKVSPLQSFIWKFWVFDKKKNEKRNIRWLLAIYIYDNLEVGGGILGQTQSVGKETREMDKSFNH